MTIWKTVVESKTEAEYEINWAELKHVYRDEAYADIIKYLWMTWLQHNRRKFIYAWTNLVLSFGNKATSRVEGINGAVKSRLKSRRGHLLEAVEHF
jgi:hypothetical protein